MGLKSSPIALSAIFLSIGYVAAQDSSPSGPTMPDVAWNCNAWHTVVSRVDSCYSIEQEYSITDEEFLEWNPAVSSDCVSNFWVDYLYCDPNAVPTSTSTPTSTTLTHTSSNNTSIPSTASSTVSSAITPQVNTTTTPYSTRYPITSYNLTITSTATTFPPTHTLGGQPSYCNIWHLVAPEDSCVRIVNVYGNRLTFDQLLEYNPTIFADCSGLYVGWYVCVSIQSQTSTSLEWSTNPTDPVIPDPTSYTSPVYSIVPNFTATPLQTGIPSSCQNFYQAKAGDTCTTILKEYGYITRDQFFSWNPALAGNCDGLLSGYYYCVANFDASDLPPPPTVTASPSPTASGTVSECDSWYLAVTGDNCTIIAESFGTFSESNFISWNPDVWSTCNNFQVGTYYCVGIPSTPTTRTVIPPTTPPTTSTQPITLSSGSTTQSTTSSPGSATQSTTSSSSSSSATSGGPVTTPSPFMPGMVEGCVRFYFRGPDGATLYCSDIAADAGISLDDFHAWNPQVGTDCVNLWTDTWFCIGTTGPGATISSGPPLPAAT